MNDLCAICVIEDSSFPDPYPSSLIEKLLRDYSHSFLVATNDSGKLVGYCVSSSNGTSAHLISIAVLPEHRRNGVGSALLQELIRYLEEHGVKDIWLEVNLENKEAIALYEKFGFEEVMVLQSYYADGSPALKMRLALQSAIPRHTESER